VTAIPLGRRLPGASSNLPGRPDPDTDPEIAPAPPLFGLAPGGVCRAASVAGSAVRSYRTVSPLPSPWRDRAVCFLWHFPWNYFRRTLSGTACPWSPDFPLEATFRRCPKRPSGRLTGQVWDGVAPASRVLADRLQGRGSSSRRQSLSDVRLKLLPGTATFAGRRTGELVQAFNCKSKTTRAKLSPWATIHLEALG